MSNHSLSLSLANMKSDAAQQRWSTQCLPPAPQAHTLVLGGQLTKYSSIQSAKSNCGTTVAQLTTKCNISISTCCFWIITDSRILKRQNRCPSQFWFWKYFALESLPTLENLKMTWIILSSPQLRDFETAWFWIVKWSLKGKTSDYFNKTGCLEVVPLLTYSHYERLCQLIWIPSSGQKNIALVMIKFLLLS